MRAVDLHALAEHLEETEWPLRASQLAAVVAWSRGRIDRAGFRRWLRSEGWPEEDLDDLTPLLEHIFATDQRMPRRPVREGQR